VEPKTATCEKRFLLYWVTMEINRESVKPIRNQKGFDNPKI
jgi:hypothetical protein